MPTLLVKTPNGDRAFRIAKSVTSIGRGPQNDVRLESTSIADRHAHVLKDKDGFRLFVTEGARVTVNGKRRNDWMLADGDELLVGEVLVIYRALDARPPDRTSSQVASIQDAAESSTDSRGRRIGSPGEARTARDRTDSITEAVPLEAFKKLYRFSAKINESSTLEGLKNNLVDAVIELANADTGFMFVLDDNGSIAIDVARDRLGNDLPKEGAKLSDSIVIDVIAKRVPVLISDALEDSIFGGSRSVVNFKLRSVIAVPIVLGEEILGVLYLGCDRVTSAFSREFLDILTVFAAQAGLLVKNAMLVKSLRDDNTALKEELNKRTFGEIVGGSPSMQGLFKAVARFAPTDISTMIIGETGTGKELIAREIHRRSSRANGPFVAINVSAIPENLLEAELFGHVKGAFTGAIADRRGKFSDADGGSLFLDEIGDMPISLQAKLLRVLQERSLEQVGSNRQQSIDIRVISATNRDLKQAQAEGTFRSDLYFRLNEMQVILPPLRERGEDIVLLARYFLTRFVASMGRKIHRFTPRALAAMKRYAWPGNVRELEAKVKKAVVMCETMEIDLGDLELEEGGMSQILNLRDAKEAYALRYIQEVLELNGGNRSKTARDLGIDPRTVFKYLEGK